MLTSKDRNLSLVFRPQDITKHYAGVEALLIPSIPNHKVLFTASRDATVKRWDVAGPVPTLEASFEGHADWVNDLALIGDLLITCSNDHTVRLWRAGSETGRLLHTLAAHSDYVTRLAAAPERRLVVSAGLRGEVFSYDVEGGLHTRFQLHGSSSGLNEGAATQVPGCRGLEDACSVYSLALSPSARLLAAGTAESLVRLMDPRTGKGLCKLRGHKDVVRALVVNSCGTKLLSGASDGSIKLWDVGMRRCVQTFQVHTDSVWALLSPDDSLSYMYSAGRDRALIRTNTRTCCSEYLALEDAPVRALAVDPDARPASGDGLHGGRVELWAATSASHVNLWLLPAPGKSLVATPSAPAPIPVPRPNPSSLASGKPCPVAEAAAAPGYADISPDDPAAVAAVASRPAPGTWLMGAAALLMQGCKSFPALRVTLPHVTSRLDPIVRKPVATIPGIPAIVEHEVLADRRRVLTRDARGNVALWDVLLGTEMVLYGKADFDAKRRELWEARSVPPWFTCDHRLGCLCITLSPSLAFTAEEYAVNVGFGDVPEDLKVNYGILLLECVFAKWRCMLVQNLAQNCGISPGNSSCGSGNAHCMRPQASSSDGCGCGGGSNAGTAGGAGGGSSAAAITAMAPCTAMVSHRRGRPYSCSNGSVLGYGGSNGRLYYRQLWPKYWEIGTVPAVICSRSDGQRWRRLLNCFDGSETEPDDVPTWVADVVLRGANVAPLVSKITFYLLPVKGSQLPTLSITRLQAPHILEVCKVAKYCCDKLQEHEIHLEVLTPGHRQRAPLSPLRLDVGTGEQSYAPYRSLELTCNGLAVPYDMNLAAVKKFLWREQDDLTFHYGVRDPANPAPQPRLGPDS